MLRVMLSRRWLGALALAVVFCIVAIFLGRWQWHRYEVKDARANEITSHYQAAPKPLFDVLPRTHSPLAPGTEWTPVTATGHYDAADLLLVRNRPNNGTYGYEVLVPFKVKDGGTLLVDRGWVDNANTASDRPKIPATPTGSVTVTGWLRSGEPSLGRDMPHGQLASINLSEASTQLDEPVYGAYAIMKDEQSHSGQAIKRPTPLEAPDTGKGPHLAYALQWWAVCLVGFVLVFVGARREVREAAETQDASTGAVPKPPKVKKVRIWDEEDG